MNEREFIRSLSEKAARKHDFLRKGIGDDCAVFKNMPGNDWLVTADMLVDGVHFDTSWHDPYLLGSKSLAVNISDIAAMGGLPQFALLSIAIPANHDGSWKAAYMEGFFSLLNEYNCILIGGDTVASDTLTMSITVLGTTPAGKAIGRNGARVGDSVYVSGNLGSAAAGLYLCKSGKFTIADTRRCEWQTLLGQHLNPKPRVQLAQLLLESGSVTALQDISDGIATDLSHICTASEVSANIEEASLPAHSELLSICRDEQLDLVNFQIRGGEDYELLFTVRKGEEAKLEQHIQAASGEIVYRIGSIAKGRGVSMLTRSGDCVSIDYQGYEHAV